MKKLIATIAIIAGLVSAAKAEYLYWQVDTTSDAFKSSGLSADSTFYSSLWAFDQGSNDKKLLGYIDGTKQGTGDISGLTNAQTASYYIELGSYAASGSYEAANYTGAFSYNDLRLEGVNLESSLASSKLKAAWSGRVTTHKGAVPEPTSGLMMLVGMALLGLKRRRA